VNFVVFGPKAPKPRELKYKFRDGLFRDLLVLLRFMLMTLMAWTLIKDIHLVYHALTDEVLTIWQRWNVSLLALAISPNVPAALSAIGLDQVYYLTHRWMESHGQSMTKVELMVRSQGSLFIIYQSVVMVIYLPITFFLVAWAVPAAVAYFFITIPLGLMLYWGIQNWETWPVHQHVSFQRQISDPDAQQGLLAELTAEEEIECLKDLGVSELDHFSYSVQRDSFLQLGMPRKAVDEYLMFSIAIAPFLLITVTLATRLYSGCGYLSSMVQTWEDRDLFQYAKAVWTSKIAPGTIVWTWI